ncbi:hypothetical protein [Poritiphilus flavus]|uniref:Uncharacterized protein n=1 Tax=Poritiphilus flavus TaxID=2697053 RepID=A0A6L9ECA9_9FLAO|nr:hypothetical protein [Poritiphilus flavus]NAS12384.1 hypothetical protein [Poritiphilus flavus]
MKNRMKIKLLFGGLVLVLLLCYQFAIKNTLVLKDKYDQLSTGVSSLEDTPRQLSLLQQKSAYYDSILGGMDLGNTSVQNNLLRKLQQESAMQNVQVMDFNPPHSFINETNELLTYSFDLKGSYNGMLLSLYSLEQKGNFGQIIHLDFEKKRNYRTKKQALTASVLLQRIK